MLGLAPKTFIIEDDPVYSEVLQKHLEEKRLNNFLVFKSAEQGLAAMHRRPEFVILDSGSEGLDELETLREIRRRHPKTEVIVLTSLRNGREEEPTPIEADDLLSKSEESLFRILERLERMRRKKIRKTRLRIAAILALVGSGLALFLT